MRAEIAGVTSMHTFQEQETKNLEGVPKTLLLPLWARAKAGRQSSPILIDRQAEGIVQSLSACQEYANAFDEMDRVLERFYQLSHLIRARCIDDEIVAFLQDHPQATIVNLGAGLDTTFDRVDNGSLTWYDLDLPEVIALRHQYIPETARSSYIAKSVLDSSWFDDIGEARNGLLFVACGLLFFLSASQAKHLLLDLAKRFPRSETVFDTMSRLFLTLANWTVLKQIGMGNQAVMHWAPKSAGEIARWDRRITVVDEYPMFSRIRLDPALGRASLNRMQFVNRMHGINIFHLRFQPA